MSYTKGPLRISCEPSQDGDYGIFGPGGILIGEAFRRVGIEDTEANANACLWASAPALLAERDALRESLKAMNAADCEQMTQYEEELASVTEQRDALRAALEKIVNHWDDLHPKDRQQARAALAAEEEAE